jgi:hypothetical protein
MASVEPPREMHLAALSAFFFQRFANCGLSDHRDFEIIAVQLVQRTLRPITWRISRSSSITRTRTFVSGFSSSFFARLIQTRLI